MSIHKSLKSERFPKIKTVHKRYERLAKLKRTEKWIEGMSIYGLPKEKIIRLKIKIKEEKKKIQQEIKSITPIEEKKKKKTSRDDKETKK